MVNKLIKIVFILVFVNIIFYVINFFQDKSVYIVFDDKNIWKIKDGYASKSSSNVMKKIYYSNAVLYSNEKNEGYFGGSEKFRFYSKNLQELLRTPNSYIVVGNYDFKNNISISETLTKEDENIIKKYLLDNNINNNLDNSTKKVIYLNDNSRIYSSTAIYDGKTIMNTYSVIFQYKDNSYSTIYLNNGEKPRISTLNNTINLDGDNNPELILYSDILGSAGNECYSLYKINSLSNKYEPIINCEEE